MENVTVKDLIDVLACAAAYSIVNSNASDEDKEIMLAFVDFVAPGLMDGVVEKININGEKQ